jgi:hypothetical protein
MAGSQLAMANLGAATERYRIDAGLEAINRQSQADVAIATVTGNIALQGLELESQLEALGIMSAENVQLAGIGASRDVSLAGISGQVHMAEVASFERMAQIESTENIILGGYEKDITLANVAADRDISLAEIQFGQTLDGTPTNTDELTPGMIAALNTPLKYYPGTTPGQALGYGEEALIGAGSAAGSVFGPAGSAVGAWAGNFIGDVFGVDNASPLQDIAAGLYLQKPISNASWAEAGFGPGGSALA